MRIQVFGMWRRVAGLVFLQQHKNIIDIHSRCNLFTNNIFSVAGDLKPSCRLYDVKEPSDQDPAGVQRKQVLGDEHVPGAGRNWGA